MGKEIPIKGRVDRAIRAHRGGKSKIALKGMEQSLRRAKKRGTAAEIAVLKPFAFMAYEQKEYDTAKSLFTRLLDLINQGKAVDFHFEHALANSILAQIAGAEDCPLEQDRLNKLALDFALLAGRSDLAGPICSFLAQNAFKEHRYGDAIALYEQGLALMTEQEGVFQTQIDQTEEILVYLFGKEEKFDARTLLRKKIIQRKATQFVETQRGQPLEPQSKPPAWALDLPSHFLETAQRNTEASYVRCPTDYAAIAEKDAQFRLMNDVTVPYIAKRLREQYPGQDFSSLATADQDWLEVYFLQQAHSSFLGAVRLAMSGQVPQAQMVLRGVLENAMYCLRIHIHPTLKPIWLNRVADPQAVKSNFKTSQIWEDFRNTDVALCHRLNLLYNKTVDDGAHPNVNAFLQHSAVINADGAITFRLNFLNPAEVENCLEDAVACSGIALEIFDLIFDAID